MSTFVTYEIDIDEAGIENKLMSLFYDPDAMLEIHNEFAKTIDPWTPFLTGAMSSSGLANVAADGVTYNVPYARYQYYGVNFNHTTTYHPLASAQWDKVAMETQLEPFIQKVKDILIRRYNQLYGG